MGAKTGASRANLRRGSTFKDLLVGVAFLVTMVLCIFGTMFVLLQVDWWPIFGVLLSFPIGYGMTLAIFAFGGPVIRGILGQEPPQAPAEPPKPPWHSRLPDKPAPEKPAEQPGQGQPKQHE